MTAIDTGAGFDALATLDRSSSAAARQSYRAWRRHYVAAVAAVDAVTALLACVVAALVRFDPGVRLTHSYSYVVLTAAAVPIWVALCALTGAYGRQTVGVGSEESRQVVRAAVLLAAIVGFASYALPTTLPRGYVVAGVPVLLVLTLAGRLACRARLRALRSRGRCLQRALVVGPPATVRRIVHDIGHDVSHGLHVVGTCFTSPEEGDGPDDAGVPVIPALDDVVSVATAADVDVVAVAAAAGSAGQPLRRLCWALEGTGVSVVVAPGLVDVAAPRLRVAPVAGAALLHVSEPSFTGARWAAKEIVERTAAAGALLVLSPVLIALCAAIRLTSDGPAFFKQTRVGQRGRTFTLWKFRTMVADAEQQQHRLIDLNKHSEGPLFKIREDPRVTRVGRWLRRYSLDELPQLINVVTGDMSLVGPRPPLPREVEQYDADARRRLLVKPGLTGLWQVSGRSDLDWESSLRLDLRYVDNRSLALDLAILLKTVAVVLRGHGAY